MDSRDYDDPEVEQLWSMARHVSDRHGKRHYLRRIDEITDIG
jgi:hypothetical protein